MPEPPGPPYCCHPWPGEVIPLWTFGSLTTTSVASVSGSEADDLRVGDREQLLVAIAPRVVDATADADLGQLRAHDRAALVEDELRVADGVAGRQLRRKVARAEVDGEVR